MEKQQESLQHLTEIRNLMERSSRFISLSGMSGVASGIIALAGWTVALWGTGIDRRFCLHGTWLLPVKTCTGTWPVYVNAILVLITALSASIFFTARNSVRMGHKAWDATARRLILNLAFPLLTGGLFCLILIRQDLHHLLISVSLIFYGLALAGASKYTLHEIRILGILQVILGLLSGFFPTLSLLLWALGFGVLHILYGWLMVRKYEVRKGRVS
jgi:hypothetical protein